MPGPQKNKMITVLFRDPYDAIAAYDWLREQGHTTSDISVLMSDKVAPAFHEIEHDDKLELKSLPAKGSMTTGAIGATVGAGLVAVVAVGTSLVLAGLGLVAAGPLGAALAGSIPGAMVGGLVGGLVGYGFPESNAKIYENAIKQGGIAIGVTPRDDHDRHLIQDTFTDLGGENILSL